MYIYRTSVLAFGVAAVSCAAHPQMMPATTTQFNWPQASTGSGAVLTVSIAIGESAVNARRLRLYAYQLQSRGPIADLSERERVLVADVSSESQSCTASASGSGRTCTVSATVPLGNDVVVALLDSKTRIIARGVAFANVAGSGTLELSAGSTAVSNLAIAAPIALTQTRFHVAVSTLAADGSIVMLDPRKDAIGVHVYAPTGVITAPHKAVDGNAGTATFTYTGQHFVNPLTVAATEGTISNTAQIFPSESVPHACAPLAATTAFPVAEPTIYRNGFSIRASVAGGKPFRAGLDTGSTTFAVAKSKLGGAQSSELIGPGQAAQETLEPSGITLKGNYYLAPVTLYDGSSALATTVPMEVFVVTSACTKGGSCGSDTTTAYMGVGFGRPLPSPSKAPGLMDGPLESTFMQLADVVEGTMHPGFILTPNSLTIGIDATNAAPFPMVTLSPFPGRTGDWAGPPVCVTFNTSTPGGCGSMLLDIGIASMFLKAQHPSSVTNVTVTSPNQQSALLNYSFDPAAPSPTPPAPTEVTFEKSSSSAVFVNTGRDALAAANYLYDAGCGEVGFQARTDRI